MTEASTDEPTRPITERDKQIIATLPGCPEWCDRKHDGLEGPMEAALWHEHVIRSCAAPRSSAWRSAGTAGPSTSPPTTPST